MYNIDATRECMEMDSVIQPAALRLITNSAGIETAIQSVVIVIVVVDTHSHRAEKVRSIQLQKFKFPAAAMAVHYSK